MGLCCFAGRVWVKMDGPTWLKPDMELGYIIGFEKLKPTIWIGGRWHCQGRAGGVIDARWWQWGIILVLVSLSCKLMTKVEVWWLLCRNNWCPHVITPPVVQITYLWRDSHLIRSNKLWHLYLQNSEYYSWKDTVVRVILLLVQLLSIIYAIPSATAEFCG